MIYVYLLLAFIIEKNVCFGADTTTAINSASIADTTFTCKGILLNDLGHIESCGDIIFVYEAEFKIVEKSKEVNLIDTVMFMILCPDADPDSFWVKGRLYWLKVNKHDKFREIGDIHSPNKDLEKFGESGMIRDAKILK